MEVCRSDHLAHVHFLLWNAFSNSISRVITMMIGIGSGSPIWSVCIDGRTVSSVFRFSTMVCLILARNYTKGCQTNATEDMSAHRNRGSTSRLYLLRIFYA